MSGEDLRRIEAALSITLPGPYRRLVDPFPVQYLRGNSGWDLWDDADALIARNREMRTGWVRGHRPWPAHWFFVGDPATACGNAIDLRDPAAPVVWLDRCDLATAAGEAGRPFEAWLAEGVLAARSALESEGIDPDGEPPPAEPWPAWKSRSVTLALVTLGGLALFGAVAGVLELTR